MFKNYFKENSKTIKKLSLALKSFVGAIAVSSYTQGDAKMGFWLLIIGALLDFLLNLLPPDENGDNVGKTIAILLICSLFLSGCKIIKPKEITSIKDSVAINYRSVDIPVKGAKVYQLVNVDSLKRAWQDLQKNGQPTAGKKQTLTDPKTKAELQVWIDQYGNLQASCEAKDQTVQALVAELTKTREKLTEKQTIIKETPIRAWIALTAMATLLAISIIINLITFKRK